MTTKTMDNTNVADATKAIADLKVVGDGDAWELICKASSESQGWMKSTKAMRLPDGCLVQVTTQQQNNDGTYTIAEALAYVPGVRIAPDINNGRQLTH